VSLRQPPHRGQHQRPGRAGSAVFPEASGHGCMRGGRRSASWSIDMKNEKHWLPARITALRDLTPTVREFEITPESEPAAGHDPGAHLQVQVLVGEPGAGRVQTRSYSVIGAPDGRTWRIAVKRLARGPAGEL